MAITHIVAFKFPESMDAAKVDGLLTDFLALKRTCVRPMEADQSKERRYIVDIKGGRNMSIENMGKDFDFAVVVTFASKDDRDYYVKEDPVHAEFAKKAKAAVEDAFVFDFENA